jgi:GNAT superfamily N-acetyltransferase
LIEGPELLERRHSTAEFIGGKESLDFFLKRFALKNQAGGTARTYVIHTEGRVVGYYSLCPSGLSRQFALKNILKGQGKLDPIPAVLLARLAVDETEHGRGLGKALLKDALLRAISGAETIGGRVIFVHAIDDGARRFYKHFGFESSPIDENVLMLLMQDAKAALDAELPKIRPRKRAGVLRG